jgi:hypothetical protein
MSVATTAGTACGTKIPIRNTFANRSRPLSMASAAAVASRA